MCTSMEVSMNNYTCCSIRLDPTTVIMETRETSNLLKWAFKPLQLLVASSKRKCQT